MRFVGVCKRWRVAAGAGARAQRPCSPTLLLKGADQEGESGGRAVAVSAQKALDVRSVGSPKSFKKYFSVN